MTWASHCILPWNTIKNGIHFRSRVCRLAVSSSSNALFEIFLDGKIPIFLCFFFVSISLFLFFLFWSIFNHINEYNMHKKTIKTIKLGNVPQCRSKGEVKEQEQQIIITPKWRAHRTRLLKREAQTHSTLWQFILDYVALLLVAL